MQPDPLPETRPVSRGKAPDSPLSHDEAPMVPRGTANRESGAASADPGWEPPLWALILYCLAAGVASAGVVAVVGGVVSAFVPWPTRLGVQVAIALAGVLWLGWSNDGILRWMLRRDGGSNGI